MKILYLTQHFPPEAAAAAFRAGDMACLLAEKGCDIMVVTGFPNHPGIRREKKYRRKLLVRENLGRVKVVRVYTPLDTKRKAWIRLLNYLSFMCLSFAVSLFSARCDLVYASTPPLFVSIPGYLLSKLKRTWYVPEVRDLWVDFAVMLGELKSKAIIALARKVENYVYRTADAVIVVTAGYRDTLVERGVSPAKIHVVYNGVNFSDPVFSSLQKEPWPPEQQSLAGKFVVAYAGNIGLAQGLEVVVEAARKLKVDPSVVFLLIGDGADRARLVGLTMQYGLRNVIFIGQQPKAKAAAMIFASDCCLVPLAAHPLFSITLPSKLFECMAFGKPVLLGVGGEARSILETAGAGRFFDITRPDSLVREVRRLKDMRHELARMGEKGRRYVQARFNRETQAAQLLKILEDTVNVRSR